MTLASTLELGSSSNTAYEGMKTNQRRKPQQGKINTLPVAVLQNAMAFLPMQDFIVCKRVFKDVTKMDYLEWIKRSGDLNGRLFLSYIAQERATSQISKSPENQIQEVLKKIASCVLRLDLPRSYRDSPNSMYSSKKIHALFFPEPQLDENPLFPKLQRFRGFHVDEITSHAPNIKHLDLEDVSNTTLRDPNSVKMGDDEEMELRKDFSGVESLIVSGYFRDEESHPNPAHIPKCFPKLKEVEFVGDGEIGSGIYSEMCKTIAELPQLTKAEISTQDRRECCDADFKAFAEHPNLRELHINNGTVTKEGLLNIQKIPHLQVLSFGKECYLKDTLDCLAQATSLRKVSLDCHIASAHLYGLIMSLQHAKNVVELDLFVSDVSDSLFSAIGTCMHLRCLTITLGCIRAPITDKVLSHLASCQELRSLTIHETQEVEEPDEGSVDSLPVEFTTPGMINLVQKLPHLELLDVDDQYFCDIDADWLERDLLETRPQLFVKKDRTR